LSFYLLSVSKVSVKHHYFLSSLPFTTFNNVIICGREHRALLAIHLIYAHSLVMCRTVKNACKKRQKEMWNLASADWRLTQDVILSVTVEQWEKKRQHVVDLEEDYMILHIVTTFINRTQLKDHHLSAVHDHLFNMFAATLHISILYPPSTTWECNMLWWQVHVVWEINQIHGAETFFRC
jgi:hypothetical protein